MLNIKSSKILSAVMAAVIGLSVAGTTVTTEAASHHNSRPQVEQQHRQPAHHVEPRHTSHRPSSHHPAPPRDDHRNSDDSSGDILTGVLIGGVIGAIIGANS